jgi:hypothetical protein
MGQNNLSRLENPDYGKHTVSSLKRIADALDVALVVRFVPFSQYVDWVSSTPHLDEGISPVAMAVPSFEDEEESGQSETELKHFTLRVTPRAEASDDITTTHTPPQPEMIIVGPSAESERQVA